ncbi:MAG: hypothetical protein RBR32_06665 [Bacteroidales bacterium]|nr:hypothetical protein [Bacteroidales bacterium]
MGKKKYKLIPHSKKRLRQPDRVQAPIAPKRITQAMLNNELTTVKRMTNTRSLLYGEIDEIPVKMIVSKTTKTIRTFLPLNYQYKYINIIAYQGNEYRITIYPDCYMECSDATKMTKIEIRRKEGWDLCCVKESIFKYLFGEVWRKYQEEFLKRNTNHETSIENKAG